MPFIVVSVIAPPSVADLNKALTELRGLEAKLQLAVAHSVDVDKDGNLPTPLPVPPAPLPVLAQRITTAANAAAMYKKKADQVEIMLESTLETAVDRNDLDPELR
jgi:hypothetical protein